MFGIDSYLYVFYILITCKFICTGNENQLKNMDNTSPLNCRIIDPDIHYFSANNVLKNTPYYNDKTFQTKFGKNQQLSMFHLNIHSIPDHFTELTSLLNNLETEIKVIAISETWLKPSHINFNMQNYNMEHELRPKKRAGGVAFYLHNVLQYKVRNDLRIGSDPESINSL